VTVECCSGQAFAATMTSLYPAQEALVSRNKVIKHKINTLWNGKQLSSLFQTASCMFGGFFKYFSKIGFQKFIIIKCKICYLQGPPQLAVRQLV